MRRPLGGPAGAGVCPSRNAPWLVAHYPSSDYRLRGAPRDDRDPHIKNFYLYGAVEPTTGESFFLELPYLTGQTFQVWLDGFAGTFPDSFNLVVLDHGAFHQAKAVQWPSHVVPVFLPPYSPELKPMERLWRDLKDTVAVCPPQTLDELSDTGCSGIQNYSQAALQSLTSLAYFVQAVDYAQRAIYV